MNSSLFSITGRPGSGKTAFLMTLAKKAALRGITIGGFLQKRIRDQDGVVLAYDLVHARTEECVRVATRQSNRKFAFEDAAFHSALTWIKHDFPAAKLVVVDELGILESQGEGHAAVLPLLLHPSPMPIICLSLRKDRATEWYQKLSIPQSQRMDLDSEDCDIEAFLQRILEATQSS